MRLPFEPQKERVCIHLTTMSAQEADFWQRVEQAVGRDHFNEQQVAALQAADGPMLIEAGPGSGKTTVLTWRVMYLLTAMNVAPRHICVVTFTRAAAEELKGRIHRLLNGTLPSAIADETSGHSAVAGDFSTSVAAGGESVWATTIHSLASSLLRRAGRRTGQLQFLSEHEQLDVVRNLLRTESVPLTDELPGEVLSEIGAARNRMQSPEQYTPASVPPAVFVRVAQRYRTWKRRQQCCDYDDLLVDLYMVLQDDPVGLRGRFAYILVDEFQDTSLLQYEILRMLAEPDGRLYAVGDVDQAIYSWRGAGPEVFLRFAKDYPETGRVVLDRNYRASVTLVAATNELIAVNERRPPKRIRSAQEGVEDGFPPAVIAPADDATEAATIADQLRRLHREKSVPWHEMAVIYRNNYQALPFIAELSLLGVPFRILGEPPNPFRHWVGQDVLAYVTLALGPVDPKLLERIMYRPNRYISTAATRAAARALLDGAALTEAYEPLELRSHQLELITQLEQHLWRLQRMAPAKAVAFIRETIGYDDYLQEQFDGAPTRRSEAMAMAALLQTVAVGFENLSDFLAFGASVQTRPRGWWRQLTGTANGSAAGGSFTTLEPPRPSEATDKAARPTPLGDGTEAITLTTCHSAKGLEFDVVAVAGLVEGVLPAPEADIEEERRLAYVAMTRARHTLILSAPVDLLSEKRTPSRFVYEATGEDLDAPTDAEPAGAHGSTTGANAADGASGAGSRAERVAAAVARASRRAADNEALAAGFEPGTKVRHKSFDIGRVRSVDTDKGYVTVLFDHYGEKQLLLQACVEKSLLERLD